MFDPEELAEGILEAFAERHDCDQIVAAFAPSSRETKAPIEGFNFYRDAAEERAFYDGREVEEQAELDKRAARLMAYRKHAARKYQGDVERAREISKKNSATWYASLTPEQKEARRLVKKAGRAKLRQKRQQALNLHDALIRVVTKGYRRKRRATPEGRRALHAEVARQSYARVTGKPHCLKCRQCESVFTPKRADAMYCSKRCLRKAQWQQQKATKQVAA